MFFCVPVFKGHPTKLDHNIKLYEVLLPISQFVYTKPLAMLATGGMEY